MRIEGLFCHKSRNTVSGYFYIFLIHLDIVNLLLLCRNIRNMYNSIEQKIDKTLTFWYLPLINGIVFILLSLLTFKAPSDTYRLLSILFSLSFILSGISDMIISFYNRHHVRNWGWSFVFAIVSMAFGVFLLKNPEVSEATLPFYVGVTLLIKSFMAIAFAIDLSDIPFSSWGYLMVLGIMGSILSFILLSNPYLGGLTVLFWAGFTMLTVGILSIYLSISLYKLK